MITVGKLKEMLEGVPEDMVVVVYADHGQTAFKASYAEPGYVTEFDEWMMESVADEDIESGEIEEEDATKVFYIGA